MFLLTIAVCSVIAAGTPGPTHAVQDAPIVDEMLRMRAELSVQDPEYWKLSTSETELASLLNRLRSEERLGDLKVDARACGTIRRRMRRCFEELGEAKCKQATWVDRMDQYIPDWDKQGFTAVGGSERELAEHLQDTPGFRDALLRPDVTHLVLTAGGESAEKRWCVVYVIRRLIRLGGGLHEVCEGGPAVTTYVGTTSYRYVRARLYRSEESPLTYQGDDYYEDVEADDVGVFRVTLLVSRFGKGKYTVAFYVKEAQDADYQIAASLRIRVVY